MLGEDRREEDAVVHAPGERRIDRLGERHPARHDVGLLRLALEDLVRRRELRRAEDVDDLVRPARRGVQSDERLPRGRHEVGLLGELALRGLERRLPLDVEQARRQLPVAHLDGVPVLLDRQHAVRLVDHENGDGPGMLHELPREGHVSVREFLTTDVPHDPVEGDIAAQHLDAARLVSELSGTLALSIHDHCIDRRIVTRSAGAHAAEPASSSNRREAFWRAIAASMSPRNSGCAAVGRDRSSGCACVAT